MSKNKELLKNTFILSLGKASTQIVSFLLLPLYTVFLSPSEFGFVDLVITYVALLVPVITIQLEMATFRFMVDARKDEAAKKRIFSTVLAIDVLILLAFSLLAAILSVFVDIPYFWLIYANIVVAVFSALFMQVARGLGDNKRFAIASTVIGVVLLITSVLFIVVAGMGIVGMLLSLILSQAAAAVYLFVALCLYTYIGRSASKATGGELAKYSLPLVPNGISWWVINVSDRTIVSAVMGVAANGVYAVSSKFALVFASLFAIFGMSWTESASVHINAPDRDKFFSGVSNAVIRIFGSLGLVLIAGVGLVFPFLVADDFSEAYLYIPILIVAAFFNAIVGIYSGIYIAKKLTKQVLYSSIGAAVINILLNIIFIHLWGLYAVAASTAIAYLAMAIFRHYDLKKHVTITYEKGIFVKIALLYAVTITLYYFDTILATALNVLVTGALVLLFNKNHLKDMVILIKQKVGRRG